MSHHVIARLTAALALLAAAAALILLPILTRDAPVRLHHWRHTPVGFTFADLQHATITPQLLATIDGEMWTARHDYHANTIRLQIQQQRLVGYRGHRLDLGYLSDVRQVTDYGRSIGLTIVLNAQTEPGIGYRYPAWPGGCPGWGSRPPSL